MDTFKIFVENSADHKPKFKIRLKHRLINSFERFDRDKFANDTLNGWWKEIRYSNAFLIPPLLWNSLGIYYEAVESHREGLFLGCAVLCRSAIENMLYIVVQYRVHHAEQSEAIKKFQTTYVDNRKSFTLEESGLFKYRFNDPKVIRAFLDPKSKKRGDITRYELLKAGKRLNIIDEKLEKRINLILGKGDIVMHYDESAHKIFLKREEEYIKYKKVSEESARKFLEYMKPLLDNKRTKVLIKETADILEILSKQTYNW